MPNSFPYSDESRPFWERHCCGNNLNIIIWRTVFFFSKFLSALVHLVDISDSSNPQPDANLPLRTRLNVGHGSTATATLWQFRSPQNFAPLPCFVPTTENSPQTFVSGRRLLGRGEVRDERGLYRKLACWSLLWIVFQLIPNHTNLRKDNPYDLHNGPYHPTFFTYSHSYLSVDRVFVLATCCGITLLDKVYSPPLK
jgi:hypothetical protein